MTMRHDATSLKIQSKLHQSKIGWCKRIGLLGFLFFLGKGLFWIAMLAITWWLR